MFHTQIRPEIDGLSKLQRFSEAMLSDYELAWKKEMMRRALTAYFRQGGTCLPCKYLSYVAKHGGKYYIYLADDAGALAVYRISGKNSFKRKARIWPKAIESAPMIRQGMAIYAAQRRASPDFYNQEDEQH